MKLKTSIRIARIAAMVALLAVSAHIRIPTPWIPLTFQTAVAIMAGILLGSRLGALSAVIYLGVGLAGLPVFATGGGPGYVLQPTFGYLMGFIPAAWIAGMSVRKGRNPTIRNLIPYLLGALFSLYLMGIPYLFFSMGYFIGRPISFKTAIIMGFLVPLPGDILKALIGGTLALRIRPHLMPEE